MSLMDTQTQEQVRSLLREVKRPVTLVVFTQEFECGYCKETRQIAEEVAALNDLVSVAVHDFVADEALAQRMGIDKIPAIAVLGPDSKDYGIRFYGIPSGYEFTSLLESILLVGTETLNLDRSTLQYLQSLQQPVHLQVFVTPTCPYCPRAVVLAHQLAYASDKVTADMVEVTEFPHLGQRYNVMGVPRTVINEHTYIEGAAPEAMLLDKVKAAVSRS